jgi:hypothetical protein
VKSVLRLALSACLVPSLVVATAAEAQPAPRVKAKKDVEAGPASPFAVTLRGGSGLGIFQDIQVPMNDALGERGDGKVGGEENADHSGFPLLFGLGTSYKSGNVTYNLGTLDAVTMRATTGPAETQSSSYTRLALSTGASYTGLLTGSWTGTAGLALGARRSSFTNISSSHFIEAATVGGQLGAATPSFGLTIAGAYAPLARFGYSEDGLFGGKAFKKSTASLAEAGVTASFVLAPKVFLDLGMEQELCHVTVDDTAEYGNFGLAVEESRHATRVYDLATTVMKVGFRKEF